MQRLFLLGFTPTQCTSWGVLSSKTEDLTKTYIRIVDVVRDLQLFLDAPDNWIRPHPFEW
jgi:hypothetical protein